MYTYIKINHTVHASWLSIPEIFGRQFSFSLLHGFCNFLLEMLWTKHINHGPQSDKKLCT